MRTYNDLDDGVRLYFKNVKEFATLTKTKERRLLEDYRIKGNIESRNTLINSNLKYACSIANSYRGKGVDFCELISEANRGLIDAIDKYDLNRDVKLISYAKWWIMQRLGAYITNRIKHSGDDLPSDHQDQYDDNDDNIQSETCHNKQYESLVADDIDNERKNEERKQIIYSLLEHLDERERDIIELYYGINGEQLNLEEIGSIYGITKERTRQIMESAMKKIRSHAMLIDKAICY